MSLTQATKAGRGPSGILHARAAFSAGWGPVAVLSMDGAISANEEMFSEFHDSAHVDTSKHEALRRDRLLESWLIHCPVCRQHWHLGCGAMLRWEFMEAQTDLAASFTLLATHWPLLGVRHLMCCWCSAAMSTAAAVPPPASGISSSSSARVSG